jgi:hypothetical protein
MTDLFLEDGRPSRVGGKYRLREKIGSGAFGLKVHHSEMSHLLDKFLHTGDVYHGNNIISGEKVAIKLQFKITGQSELSHEFQVYQTLGRGTGTPLVHWFGTECNYNAMVIDLLGPSVEALFGICKRSFSLKTVVLLADQMIILSLQYLRLIDHDLY